MYLDITHILKMTRKAERTVTSKLQSFAASGHHHNSKSARLYLQQITDLKDNNPSVHQNIKVGHNVYSRSSHLWIGLSNYLIIEHVLGSL